MQAPKTLHDFFAQSHTRYRVYDMGRGIRKVPREQFEQFELGNTPWPWPLQQQAWLALLAWNEQDRNEHFIWFLKFPLDENGLLIQATRDDFMGSLLHSIGQNLQASREGGTLQDGMSQSPYGFKPKESSMAAFHAIAAQAMDQAPSRFLAHAQDYLDGGPGYDQWAFVGIQGLADVVARLDQDANQARLLKALPQLPAPALIAICGLLENIPLSTVLAEVLAQRLRRELQTAEADIQMMAALLRAFAQSPASGMREALIHELLQGPHARQIEILAAIAARNWEVLQNPKLARLFVEALADNPLGQDAFNQIMADLLYLPGMRASLL
ncbi:MAG: DUF3549 family protein, partial [Gammaproteobacteria bacterium]|nr:DUF3549 family protein [Gammaproteobacteria bacterium]